MGILHFPFLCPSPLQSSNCVILHFGFKNPSFKFNIYGNEIASKDIICDIIVEHVSNDSSFNDYIYITCKKTYWVIKNIFSSFCYSDANV